jgi:hypothetical protein
MNEIVCLLPNPTEEIGCECIDGKPCDIHIDDGGNLVCRHGSNEGTLDGAAAVTCPLEIESERVKWEDFLKQEIGQI